MPRAGFGIAVLVHSIEPLWALVTAAIMAGNNRVLNLATTVGLQFDNALITVLAHVCRLASATTLRILWIG